jgi:hypothetical protein
MTEVICPQAPTNTSIFSSLPTDKWIKRIVKATLNRNIFPDYYGRLQLEGIIFSEYGDKQGIKMTILDSKGKAHYGTVKIKDSMLDGMDLESKFMDLEEILETEKPSSSLKQYEELQNLAYSVDLSDEELQRSSEAPSKFLILKLLTKDEVEAAGNALRELKSKQMADKIKEQIQKVAKNHISSRFSIDL